MANGKCSTCKTMLTEDNCSPSVLKHGSHDCKSCKNAKAVEKYRSDPKERKKDSERHSKRWKTLSIEQKRHVADNNFKSKYGVSVSNFSERLAQQDGQCVICSVELTASVDQKSSIRACQDHDHKTDKLRDILCNGCNLMLGYAKDNPEILANAIKYLQKHAEGSTTQTNGIEATQIAFH